MPYNRYLILTRKHRVGLKLQQSCVSKVGQFFVISAMVVHLLTIMALLHIMRVVDFGLIFSFNC